MSAMKADPRRGHDLGGCRPGQHVPVVADHGWQLGLAITLSFIRVPAWSLPTAWKRNGMLKRISSSRRPCAPGFQSRPMT